LPHRGRSLFNIQKQIFIYRDINKLEPVCKPKFYSKYGVHRGLQSVKKKKLSSSEQCINIPETKEEEEQSSYLIHTATTDR
jgi:hypothetical protein